VTAALRFRNLTLGYDRHPAVHHLDGAIETGALVAVVGPNGAGKSTLFKGIVGVLKPLAGKIERGELEPQEIAYLPQAAELDRSFPINVYDMVAMGLWHRTGLLGGIDRNSRASIERAIAAVGLTGFERRAIATLSGGQMQRMLFARLLLQDARVIVLDEPFNAVDAKTSADLFGLVRRWHAEQRTVLAALHDIDFVRSHFPETLLLAREPVAWGRTATVLTPENLLTARRMCEAFDEHAEECAGPEATRPAAVAGERPSREMASSGV
jgi:zinc/manganese transport system ATP-binding protein